MVEPDQGEEVFALVRRTLPDIRCLRCGFDEFLVVTDVDALGIGDAKSVLLQTPDAAFDSGLAVRSPVVTLACRRCGHLENHVTGILMRAGMPVVAQGGGNDDV